MFGGESSHLPLKLNTSGVIPAIFASSLLLLPATVTGFAGKGGPDWLRGRHGYDRPRPAALLLLYVGADRLLHLLLHRDRLQPAGDGRQSEEIRRLHPRHPAGQGHAEYLDYVLTRLTVLGAALSGRGLRAARDADRRSTALPFYFGGTSLLIVVSVTMDTVAQIQSHLLAHQYEGLIKKSKLGGRRG